MKRYKLLKDLPTFSAGDIFELRGDGCLYWGAYLQDKITPQHCKHWQPDVMAYHKKTLERFPNVLSDWFEEIKDGGGWKPNQGEKYWYIDHEGEILAGAEDGFDDIDAMVTIGDCFKTRKEAEEAVEKLKAWKRLKDKGFKFYGWRKNCTGTYDFLARWKGTPPKMHDIINDLDLLFSGEDD